MTVPLSPMHEFADDGSSVRVAVRARPLIEKEIVENCKECVSYSQDGRQVVLGKDRLFTFDHVFGPVIGQQDVYLDCVKPLVEGCCAGYNATVLAYGQTGSGKTFTMGCGNNLSLLEEELGILPRVIRQLYESIEERSGQAEFLIKCAFVEIHNEEIRDLLHPDTPPTSISIREDAKGDIILAGVKEEVVTSYENMIRCLERGSVFRTTGSTLMNQHSSRSHAIFTIIVEQRTLREGSSSNDVITAKFHLVDLAGSERAKRTGAVGVRFKESVTINSGLLALGNVISALGDERRRGQHVPYRDSKLTRMLQDSLGGNSRTCMIACISTADTNFEETLNTLRYANRARNIRNRPVINRDPQAIMLNQLRQEVRALQLELLNFRMRSMGLESVNGSQSLEVLLQDESHQQYLAEIRARANLSDDATAELQTVRRKSREREQECIKLKQEIHALQSQVSKLQEEILELRTERDHHQLKLDEVNMEMMSLVQAVPQWRCSKDITYTVKSYLSDMTKRIVGEIDGGTVGCRSLPVSPSSVDRSAKGGVTFRRSSSQKDIHVLTEQGATRERIFGSGGRSRFQREDSQAVATVPECSSSPSKADARIVNSNSPGRLSRGTPNIINQHLRTIRVLEERLAAKKLDMKAKEDELKAATEDLARDERIFAEKIKEINALKKLARDLTSEKETLLLKTQKDSAIISRLSQDALAKEDELAQLHASFGALQSGRSDAFVMSGAYVPEDSGVPSVWGSKLKPNTERGVVHIDNVDTTHEVEGEEKEKLLSEKRAIEEQKSLLEEDVWVQTREFKRSKQVMDKQLLELAFNIQQKERLVKELARNESEVKHLTVQYEARKCKLEAQMKHKEEEVDYLRKELEAIDKNSVQGIEEKNQLREKYEEKMKKVMGHLRALKKQRWEQESQHMELEEAKSYVNVQQLNSEITRMRIQQEALKKRIKVLCEKYEDEHDLHQKNMAILKRESESQSKRLRDLELENQRQQQVVRRKIEEKALNSRKLTEHGFMDMDVLKTSNRERSIAYDQSLKATARKGSAALAVPESSQVVNNMHQMEAILDQKIDKLLKMKAAKASKNKQEAKKDKLLLEKDDCLNEKSKLELKDARAVHGIAQVVKQKKGHLQILENEYQIKLRKADEARTSGKISLADELSAEVEALRDKCEFEKEMCIDLEDAQHLHISLMQNEELEILDEHIESLDAQAEYVNLAIAEHDRDIQGLRTKESVMAQLELVAPDDAKVILHKYVEKLVDVIEKKQQSARTMAKLELQLKEKTQALAEVEGNSHLKELEFDRRLTELQIQHAKNVQYLLRQVEMVSATPVLERQPGFWGLFFTFLGIIFVSCRLFRDIILYLLRPFTKGKIHQR